MKKTYVLDLRIDRQAHHWCYTDLDEAKKAFYMKVKEFNFTEEDVTFSDSPGYEMLWKCGSITGHGCVITLTENT